VNLRLAGRTALVVGGGSGLGRAVARTLGAEGANVAVAGRHLDTLAQTAAEVGERALAVRLDLADRATLEPALDTVHERFGDVDVLFNSGGGPPPTPAAGQPPELWRQQFEAIVLGVIELTDLALPAMRERRFGRIITNTSSGVVTPIPNLAISNALRLALVGWSKTLSREVAADGVTVNVVAPGRIFTNRIRQLDEARAQREETSREEAERASIAAIPAGRYGEPEEYATRARLPREHAGVVRHRHRLPRRRRSRPRDLMDRAEQIRQRYLAVDASNVADVLDELGLPDQGMSAAFRPFPADAGKLAGWAFTIGGEMTSYESAGGDPAKMEAAAQLGAGDVSVWSGRGEGVCFFGELISIGMKERGCVGALVDGGIRDVRWLPDLGFPVYARYRTPVQSIGRWRVASHGEPVPMPGATAPEVTVSPGDLVLADEDGAIVVPARLAEQVLERAEMLQQREVEIRAELARGLSLAEALARFGHV
jgi:4-hydroxy-4-methyl-2-oxoglutarate aldolase